MGGSCRPSLAHQITPLVLSIPGLACSAAVGFDKHTHSGLGNQRCQWVADTKQHPVLVLMLVYMALAPILPHDDCIVRSFSQSGIDVVTGLTSS